MLIENFKLRESDEGGSVVFLTKCSPFLQVRGCDCLRAEIQELWMSKKTMATPPPSSLISIADLQKFLLQFSDSYLCNLLPPSWIWQMAPKKVFGRDVSAQGYHSKLLGGFSGIHATETKIMNCETLVRQFVFYV